MKLNIRKTLIAGAIAGLLAGPAFAATDTSKEGVQSGVQSQNPTKSELGQPGLDHPALGQPARETPRMGADDAGTTARTTSGSNSLYTRSADDLDGMDVVDRTGDKVGEVKQIVLAPDRKSAQAVISMGGLLGMGARDITVLFDDLRQMDDKLQLSATKEEIAAMKDSSQGADNLVELKGGAPISGSIVEFSAFEQDKEANKPGAASRTPNTDTMHPATGSRTPNSDNMNPATGSRTPNTDAGNPATAPETPRVPQ